MELSKYKQFAVIFTLCGLGALSLGGAPNVSAHGDGVVKFVQLENPPEAMHKSTEQLDRENPRPKYERGMPTLDVSDETVQAKKSDSVAGVAQASAPEQNLAAGRKIDYVALTQPVDQVLRELGQGVGLRVVASSGVTGMVRKRHFKGEFVGLMDRLTQEYNLFWFADGGVVYVDNLDSQTTKVVKMKNLSKEQVFEAMDIAGMGRAKSRVVVNDGTARVTGPDSFQKSMETLLASLAPEDNETDIKIIKYGSKIN